MEFSLEGVVTALDDRVFIGEMRSFPDETLFLMPPNIQIRTQESTPLSFSKLVHKSLKNKQKPK